MSRRKKVKEKRPSPFLLSTVALGKVDIPKLTQGAYKVHPSIQRTN